MESHFNNFDYVVLGIMAFSCLFAFFRGLVREVLSLAAWVGAGIVTIYYFPVLVPKLQAHFKSPVVAASVAALGIYIAALFAFGMLNMIIIKTIKRGPETGMLDNLLGLAFGAARGALIVSLGFFMLTMAMSEKEYPDWLKESVTRPYAEKGAIMLVKVAPDYLREISTLEKKAKTEVENGNNYKKSAPDDSGDEKNDSGYNRLDTKQLDRLIEGTGNQ